MILKNKLCCNSTLISIQANFKPPLTEGFQKNFTSMILKVVSDTFSRPNGIYSCDEQVKKTGFMKLGFLSD